MRRVDRNEGVVTARPVATVYYRRNMRDWYPVPPPEVDASAYEKVAEVPVKDPLAFDVHTILEALFQEFNLGEQNYQRKIRSMSTGDVVVFAEGDAWYCASVGWVKVNFRAPTVYDFLAG